MNGAHDMGGMMGFGPVTPEPNEPVFHSNWESRAFALSQAMGKHGAWNLDEDRSACENRPPPEYMALSYYEIWFAALNRLLREKGMLDRTPDPSRVLRPEDAGVKVLLRKGYTRPPQGPARFAVGVSVRTRNIHPEGHTRLPRYLRGHPGEIVAVHGAHVFPDSNAHGGGENPQWLYTVRFTAAEVWGSGSTDKIHADLWEPYLEPA